MKLAGINFGKMGWGTGIAVGAGIIILGPIVVPVVGGVLKSLSKSLIKGGLIVYEKGKVAVEETKETFEDLAAEAKAEMNQEKSPKLKAPAKKKAEASS